MKLVSLISTGIDSPVATYLFSKRADEMICVHADTGTFSDPKERQYVLALLSHLQSLVPCRLKAYLIHHDEVLTSFIQQCTQRFTCVFCKRMMVRYAAAIAEKEQADALVMGDSLGQVASQTSQNISVIDAVTSLPILRPLIGKDKEDVVSLAKNIGTYELSIQQKIGCHAVPSKPATGVSLEQITAEEQHLPLDVLVQQAVGSAELLSF